MFESFTTSLKNLVDDKILRHFRESHHPIEELGMASAVGLFWALTPLVGIQMLLVTANWVLFRAFRLHFHLVIGVAWVWLSNPFTMVPLYYSFYITGYYFFSILGYAIDPISAATFGVVLDEASALGMTNGLIHWMKFMIYQLGWPMLIGGFVLGVPASIAGYPITVYFVRRFRMRSARQLGISYEEWEERFVLHRGEVARSGPGVEHLSERAPEATPETVQTKANSREAPGAAKTRKPASKKKSAGRSAKAKTAANAGTKTKATATQKKRAATTAGKAKSPRKQRAS